MTNNFDLIRDYMINEQIPYDNNRSGDLFFEIMVIRRGKDHPGLPAANYTFKTYYLDSIEKYDYFKDEIITVCNVLKMRAYVSVNVKSKEQITKAASKKFTESIFLNEYKKPWRIFDHMFGKIPAKNDNTWLIDVDDLPKDIQPELEKIISSCKSQYNPIIINRIPTRSGCHLLTRPFNVAEYENKWKDIYPDIEVPAIKKNHITLLYENIDLE